MNDIPAQQNVSAAMTPLSPIASSRVGAMEENPWFSLRYLDVRKMMVIPGEVILIFIP